MGYSSPLPQFPTNIIVIASARWWSVSRISSLFTTLSSFYFPAHASRETALELFHGLNQAPFSLDSRFPTDPYISDSDPYFGKLIYQLVAALTYSDRLLNKSGGNTSNDSTYLAAKSSYFNVLPLFLAYIRDPQNYLVQASFEQLYTLTWS